MKPVGLYSLFFLMLWAQLGIAAEITPALQQEIDRVPEKNAPVRALVFLDEQVEIPALEQQLSAVNASPQQRAYAVITALQDKAAATQRGILSYLESLAANGIMEYQPFWIANMIRVETTPAVLQVLAARPEVALLEADPLLEISAPAAQQPALPVDNGAEAGLKLINAHKMWEMGFRGEGRLVMNIDTGVEGTHPALAARWRGNHVPASQAWFDPAFGSTFPNDCNNHGTHGMGIIAGLNPAAQDTIGAAPAAEWIAAQTLCAFPHLSNTILAFQWAMDPDGNPTTTDDMPDVIAGFSDATLIGCPAAIYHTVLNAVEAAGIAAVFPVGAAGPAAATIQGFGNINTSLVNAWATGSIDGFYSPLLPVTSFSSRGPSNCGGSGSLLIKPEAVAPGINIRSAITGGGYAVWSGTAASSAHVAGAIALLKQAFPNKTGQELKLALYLTARETPADSAAHDPGEPPGETTGEDHNYGMGLIDVLAAFNYLQIPVGVEPPSPPGRIVLYRNFPNPFNPSTNLGFRIADRGFARLEVFDVAGGKVATLVERELPPGEHWFQWDGRNEAGEAVASGIYLYRLRVVSPGASSGEYIQVRKMALIR